MFYGHHFLPLAPIYLEFFCGYGPIKSYWMWIRMNQLQLLDASIADPDPGWTTQSIFPRAKKPIFWVKILKLFNADPRSGMEKFGWGIRDGKNSDPGKHSDPGSGINIPDPQHCWMRFSAIDYQLSFLRKPEGPGPGCGELPGGGRPRRHHHHPAHLPVLARRTIPRRPAQGAHRADPGLVGFFWWTKPLLRIRIWIWILQIHVSLRKNGKKNLDFYCFVTSFWLFTFE